MVCQHPGKGRPTYPTSLAQSSQLMTALAVSHLLEADFSFPSA
jgi:hypothetical protein